jgi:hypothetical protein
MTLRWQCQMKQWIGDEKGVLPRPFFGKVHKKMNKGKQVRPVFVE